MAEDWCEYFTKFAERVIATLVGRAIYSAWEKQMSTQSSSEKGKSLKLLTIGQVAELTGFTERHIRTLVKRRGIPSPIRPAGGRHIRFREADIEAWVACGCPPAR